jgi:DNA-binding Lrp family transcriptional regulator
MANTRKVLDEHEVRIVKALIKDPRMSDNRLGDVYGIPVRTVNRKRHRLEAEGLLRYYAELDSSASGTGYFACRHLYTVKFRLSVTVRQVQMQALAEPSELTVFTETVYESHVAEIDGRAALVLVVEGRSDADIVDRFQENILPELERVHGKSAIEDISTVRLLQPVRVLRNYLPALNMEAGRMKEDWPLDAVFVV